MFSEMCDTVVQRSGRLDRLNNGDIPAYANTVFRELQALGFFYKDGVEFQIAASSTDPTIWTYPQLFRKMRTAQYPDGSFPDHVMPGKGLRPYIHSNNTKGYYYSAANYIAFQNAASGIFQGNPTNNINIYYYQWLPRLKYYAVGLRPATYDETLAQWTYFNLSANPDPDNNLDYTLIANQPIALARVTNWTLISYIEMMTEGVLAKLFKGIKDDTRGIQSYSLWEKYKQDILKTEIWESLGK